jgi:hypothetical protein
MKNQTMDHTAYGELRLAYTNRVVSGWPRADVTLGDIADVMGELGPRHLGHPIAIDVTMTELRFPAPCFRSVGMIYEDDPAAEFEDMTSQEVMTCAAVLAAQFRA